MEAASFYNELDEHDLDNFLQQDLESTQFEDVLGFLYPSEEETTRKVKQIKVEHFLSESEISASELSTTDFSSCEDFSDFEAPRSSPPVPQTIQTQLQSFQRTVSTSPISLPIRSNAPQISNQTLKRDPQQQMKSEAVSKKVVSVPTPVITTNGVTKVLMKGFEVSDLNDFKHVIYNMLVENYNDPSQQTFVLPVRIVDKGVVRTGFQFNSGENPDKKIPELYARHIRKCHLEKEDPSAVFVQDLYKFYYRASMELLSKYFEKRDKYTFLDEDTPLFVPGGSIHDAQTRLKQIKTRARKKRSRTSAGLK